MFTGDFGLVLLLLWTFRSGLLLMLLLVLLLLLLLLLLLFRFECAGLSYALGWLVGQEPASYGGEVSDGENEYLFGQGRVVTELSERRRDNAVGVCDARTGESALTVSFRQLTEVVVVLVADGDLPWLALLQSCLHLTLEWLRFAALT